MPDKNFRTIAPTVSGRRVNKLVKIFIDYRSYFPQFYCESYQILWRLVHKYEVPFETKVYIYIVRRRKKVKIVSVCYSINQTSKLLNRTSTLLNRTSDLRKSDVQNSKSDVRFNNLDVQLSNWDVQFNNWDVRLNNSDVLFYFYYYICFIAHMGYKCG